MTLKSCLRVFIYLLTVVIFLTTVNFKANAATLTSTSDTVTTSRPSPSTPLSADAGSGSGSVSVYNNGSIFLASDSAHFYGGTPENVNVATMSADQTQLFFTGTTANAHLNGTVVATPITAMHKIQFTTVTSIPSGGSIIISFPNAGSTDTNAASPSASTFMFNALSNTNIKTNNATTCTFTITQSAGGVSTIKCVTSGVIAGGTVVTFLIGCSAATGANCTTQVPTLINPTKNISSFAAGVSQPWKVAINTFDGSNNALDNSSTQVATIESVQVLAHIEPNFTFTITGIATGTNLADGSHCGSGNAYSADSTHADSGISSTANVVNLGTLTGSLINFASQQMEVTSNSVQGYTITATSSGHLINPANGFFIGDAQGTPTNNDTPAPTTISVTGNQYGFHACGKNGQTNQATSQWSALNFANPSQTFYYTLVNVSVSPAASGDFFFVQYAAAPSGTSPPGDYRTTETYVATAIF